MAFNPLNPLHRNRLFRKIENDYRKLEDFRRPRTELIDRVAGDLYGREDRLKRKTLVNILRQAAYEWRDAMVGGTPKFNALPRNGAPRWFATHLREALNRLVEEIRFRETLESVALDAMFGAGLFKVCQADSAAVEAEVDLWMDPGRPYVSRVSFDDYCFDTGAKERRACFYEMDRYRIPFYKLKDSNRYDQKVVAQLTPDSKWVTEGDFAEDISFGRETDHDEAEPMIYLADVYLPCLREVHTWAIDRDMKPIDTPPVAKADWDVNDAGPYKMLNLGPVPDQILPSSPLLNIRHLADLLNSILRKLDTSSRNQKDVLLVLAGNEKDAQKIRDAKHTEIVAVNNPDAFKVATFNGPSPSLNAFQMVVMNFCDRMMGNLKLMGGLGQQFETATQEMAARQDVQATMGEMFKAVLDVVSEIGRDLGRLMFHDEYLSVKSSVTYQGFERYGTFESNWEPDVREGEAEQYDVRVEAYSLVYQSPQSRAMRLKMMAQDPFIATLVQQGMVEFDVREYMQTLAEYEDMPEYSLIWKTAPKGAEQVMAQDAQGMGAIGKPNGKYQRTSVSAGPQGDGQNAVLAQTMQGAEQPGITAQ